MPNLDRPLNLGSATIAFASFMMLVSAAFGQTDVIEVVADDAANESQAVQQADQQFQELLDRAIHVTSKRYLIANTNTPWQIFHYILAMRQESLLRLGNTKVNAIEWLSTSEPQFDNQPWLLLTPHGAKFHPYTKKFYFEGHPSQFLALLSHSDLPMDYPFHVQGKVLTLKDLVNNTMKEVNTKEEVTWVLWALQHFLKSDATWLNQANEPWSIERLVQIETAGQVVGAPCGGNHRLFALTRARDKYLLSGGALRGVWFQADQKIKQHIEIARSLQNPDGSFSSDWYKGPGQTTDINLRFNTSGHTMEFLAASLPKERLTEQWVRNAVWMLSRELIINQNVQIDCGPLFHSLDALILYRDRIRAKSLTNPRPPEVAINPPSVASKLDLKSKPDPAPFQKLTPVPEPKSTPAPTPKPPETVEAPDSAKPLEAKPSRPVTQSAPIPIPDELPESQLKLPASKLEKLPASKLEKSPETKLDVPKISDPKPAPGKTDPTKTDTTKTDTTSNDNEFKKTLLSKIDPAKLANVGQVAPTAKITEPRTESSQAPQKNPGLPAVPSLLPEESATPLGRSLSQNGETRTSVKSDQKKMEVPNPSSTTIDIPPELADTDKPSEVDQPASALEVANP